MLFISGYSGRALTQHGIEAGTAFLAKPFQQEALAAKVAELLKIQKEAKAENRRQPKADS